MNTETPMPLWAKGRSSKIIEHNCATRGLKARHMTAQGNALGHLVSKPIQALKGRHKANAAINTRPMAQGRFCSALSGLDIRGRMEPRALPWAAMLWRFQRGNKMAACGKKEIAGILQTIDRKISVHERKRAALTDLFQTLLHQLMTAQIRVDKLDIDTSEVTT